jgi:hypothetical protein
MDVLHEPSFHQPAYYGVTVNSYSLQTDVSNAQRDGLPVRPANANSCLSAHRPTFEFRRAPVRKTHCFFADGARPFHLLVESVHSFSGVSARSLVSTGPY